MQKAKSTAPALCWGCFNTKGTTLMNSNRNHTPTLHQMNLQQDPFDKIVSGAKTIELRLNDDKRRKVNVGDVIEFTCNGHIARVRVTALYPFDSFETLYSNLDLVKCGYLPSELPTAKASDMLQYYTLEQQEQWGVLGIEFTLLSVN